MSLVATEMKTKLQLRIHTGLQRVFASDVAKGSNYPGVADEFWVKLADAISDIAIDIVTEIQTNAEVLPGQAVATSGGPGATVSPGKIL